MWVHFDIIAKKVFKSKVGSDAVSAFGMGNAVPSFLSVANNVLATIGRSFDVGWLWDRAFVLFGWFVESVRTPVTMLRLMLWSF